MSKRPVVHLGTEPGVACGALRDGAIVAYSNRIENVTCKRCIATRAGYLA